MRFIFLLSLLLPLAACGTKAQDAAASAAPAQRAKDVAISESDAGVSNWTLQTPEADFYSEPHSYVVMQRPHMVFRVDGRDDSAITARTGRYDMDKNLITMTGRVVATSAREGAKVETEKAFYDTENKTIWANVPVKLTRAGVVVQGRGLRASGDLSEIQIFKQTTILPPNIKDFGELENRAK